jgi:hypothetical protein
MQLTTLTRVILIFWSFSIFSADHQAELSKIRDILNAPETYLKKDGPLVIMGNASLDKAQFIFLPEIHDDPDSLSAQLALVAREKNKNTTFLVLDESLAAHKKSMWDFFSQKTMEILAARDQRQNKEIYVPRHFEVALQNLANKFRAQPGQLNYIKSSGLWTLADFERVATPFYGWDAVTKTSLVDRNVQMVDTLKDLERKNDRILIMAGARHIPELEFMTSQRILCAASRFRNINEFFNSLQNQYGKEPNLRNGIGATAPIHEFLANKRYAIVFNRSFYGELDRIVEQFKSRLGADGCMTISE